MASKETDPTIPSFPGTGDLDLQGIRKELLKFFEELPLPGLGAVQEPFRVAYEDELFSINNVRKPGAVLEELLSEFPKIVDVLGNPGIAELSQPITQAEYTKALGIAHALCGEDKSYSGTYPDPSQGGNLVPVRVLINDTGADKPIISITTDHKIELSGIDPITYYQILTTDPKTMTVKGYNSSPNPEENKVVTYPVHSYELDGFTGKLQQILDAKAVQEPRMIAAMPRLLEAKK